jgi:Uma2 family endonuclease
MAGMAVVQRMTAEQFMKAFPEDTHPLIAGEVVVAQPGFLHQRVQSRLLVALNNWTDAERGGGVAIAPLDVQMDDDNVYAPDILWYAALRAPSREDRPPYPLPDLAVEVRSPSTWRYDVGVKRQVYEQHGLRALWLVDTDAESVLVFRRSKPAVASFDVCLELEGGQVLASPLLPGFALPTVELFAR